MLELSLRFEVRTLARSQATWQMAPSRERDPLAKHLTTTAMGTSDVFRSKVVLEIRLGKVGAETVDFTTELEMQTRFKQNHLCQKALFCQHDVCVCAFMGVSIIAFIHLKHHPSASSVCDDELMNPRCTRRILIQMEPNQVYTIHFTVRVCFVLLLGLVSPFRGVAVDVYIIITAEWIRFEVNLVPDFRQNLTRPRTKLPSHSYVRLGRWQ